MQIKHVAACLAQRGHFRMGCADSVRISDLGGGGRAGNVVGRLRKADTQSWCREWKVIKQHSTFDPINLLSRTSLTRKGYGHSSLFQKHVSSSPRGRGWKGYLLCAFIQLSSRGH